MSYSEFSNIVIAESSIFYLFFSVGVKYSNILNPYRYLKLSVTTNTCTYNLLDVLMGFKFSFYELSLFITLKMDK